MTQEEMWLILRSEPPKLLLDYALSILGFHDLTPEHIIAHNSAEFCADDLFIKTSLKALEKVPELSALSLLYCIPPRYLTHLERRQHLSWERGSLQIFVRQQMTRPPVYLRLRSTLDMISVSEELNKAGCQVVPIENTLALKLGAEKNIMGLGCYQNGLVEIQDLASQHIGEAIACENGDFIWDACAGGGGKTMQLAAKTLGNGQIYASDNRVYKFDELKKRAKRGGFNNIQTMFWGGDSALTLPIEVQKIGGFDLVLVDAPCSSSGTWRRNPVSKLRYDLASLPELIALQRQILNNASIAVKPNGHLVYATCSWLVEENEDIVTEFLKNHPEFNLISSTLVGCPQEDADTMFYAKMQRI